MKKTLFSFSTILLIVALCILMSFKPAKETSVKTNSLTKNFACAAYSGCNNGKSFGVWVTIKGTSGMTGGTAINFRYYVGESGSRTVPVTDINGGGCMGMVGTMGQIQGETTGTPWMGSVDIYAITGSGTAFIKTVVFSTPQIIQYFTLDGSFQCRGYTFTLH